MLPQISKEMLVERGAPVLPDDTPIRIMQFGEGNFLRAFVDWIFKRMNDTNLFRGAVRVIQPIPVGLVDKLADQGYVYSLAIRGMRNGAVVDEASFVDVIRDGINPYTQWERFLASATEPDLRYIKVRVLNGAHTGNVLGAYLAGMNTVGEMMADDQFGGNLRAMVNDEILPGVELSEGEKLAYADAVFERFQNPFVRHELLSISLNSVSKWKVRVLPSLKDYVAAKSSLPARTVFSLAVLIAFYRGEWDGDGFSGRRKGDAYPIRDDKPVLDFFHEAWRLHAADPTALARVTLSNSSLWDADLTSIPGLVDAVANGLKNIDEQGIRAAMPAL